MSHSVHPYSHRLGIIRDWRSRWFGLNKQYRDYLKGDIALREYLAVELRPYLLAGIEIERTPKILRIVIKTARPGMIIGRNGEGVIKLREKIVKLLDGKKLRIPGQDLKLDIEEVKNPESNATVVGMMIAEGLEKRLPFRRVMKQMIEKVMANRDVQGVKIKISGRLGGTDIARSEDLKKGRIPLQTFRADIDFARERAHMTYGDLGIKVWIYKGDVFSKEANTTAKKAA
ncbi:MAG: 30S ribosomal protein S3 [Candidatus Taylorbacteria bacterium]|nr:30S ribosomal protein S3 [Candidatus Taylorbacteria bacterium]